MDQAKLDEICASIKQIGIIQPIVVRSRGDGYELIAGERRYRGAQRAGLTRVPIVVRQISDQEMLEYALIENMHREDLSPIDRALGFKSLMGEFKITQKRISELFNLSRSAVANTLRLLDLDDNIKSALHEKQITEGHARSLLAIRDRAKQKIALKRIIKNNLSVRETEELARKFNKYTQIDLDVKSNSEISIHEQKIIDDLRLKLGTRISIIRDSNPGRIEIEFYSDEDFERIIETLLS